MIAVMVDIACGRKPVEFLYYLFNNPDPKLFFAGQRHLISAPPGGLYLADVVYDPRMFKNPYPLINNPWNLCSENKGDNLLQDIQ